MRFFLLTILFPISVAMPEYGPDPYTVMGSAAFSNHPVVVKDLLDAGVDPNGTAKYGVSTVNTPLMLAVLAGSKEIVQLLLQYGADPLIINNYGHDALFYAERDHHKEIARLLKCAIGLSAREKFERACK